MGRIFKSFLCVFSVVAVFLAWANPSAAGWVWVDATGSVAVWQSAFNTDTANNVYYTLNHITNPSASPLTGQVRFVVLTSSTPVTNADGTSGDGKPFRYLSSSNSYSLDPYATSTDVRIEFQKPKKAPTSFFCTLRIERYIDESLLDDDNDGVANISDMCPGTLAGSSVDITGCMNLDIGILTRVSRTAAGIDGNGSSGVNSISADGRFIAFSSASNNLVAGDGNGVPDANGNGPTDCFVKDMVTGAIERVSVDSTNAEGRGSSYGCIITPDARYVLFSSDASNLVSGDRNKVADVFLRDRTNSRTIAASVDSTGAMIGGSGSSISANGNKIAFASYGIPAGPGLKGYVRDLSTGVTTQVSTTTTGTDAYIHDVVNLSADGRYVAFSSSDQITASSTNNKYQIYRRDLATGQAVLISKTAQGASGNDHSYNPVMSYDGRYVAFDSNASNFGSYARQVYVVDSTTGVIQAASLSSAGYPGGDWAVQPNISGDGRFVSFYTDNSLTSEDTLAFSDVYVRDRLRGSTELVSKSLGGISGNAWSGGDCISSTGRFVAFSTGATNIIGGNASLIWQGYVRDTWGGQVPPPQDTNPPTQPTGLTATDVSDVSAILSWQPSIDDNEVTGYRVVCNKLPQNTITHDFTVMDAPLYLNGLQPSTGYQCTVTAKDEAGNSSTPSVPVQFTTYATDTTPPTPPILHGGRADSPTTLYIEFTPAKDDQHLAADPYKIYVDGIRWINASVANCDNYGRKYPPPSLNVSGLSPGTYYTITMSATDLAGNVSAPSQPARFRTGTGDTSTMEPVHISSPFDGATVQAGTVEVSGTVDQAAVSVVVNGQEAALTGRNFTVSSPLKAGENLITATAYAIDGVVINSASISIVSQNTGEPFTVDASANEGAAPLDVVFNTAPGQAIVPASYHWDLDGDGVYETESTEPVLQEKIYTTPGVTVANIRVIDTTGLAYVKSVPIRVQAALVVDLELTVANPMGLATDVQGNVYVAQPAQGTVSVFDNLGNLLRQINHQSAISPIDVAVDYRSNVFVLDSASDCVHKFDKDGVYLNPVGCGVLLEVSGIATDGVDIFVSAAPDLEGGEQIYKFDENGNLDGKFGLTGATDGELALPDGLWVNDGKVYVADYGKSAIEVFSTDGYPVKTLPIEIIDSPVDIAIEPFTKELLVVDEVLSKVLSFDAAYALVESAGVGLGLPTSPHSVSPADKTHPGMFYVSYPQANKIVRVRLPVDLPTIELENLASALAANQIEAAVKCFEDNVRLKYREKFENKAGRFQNLVTALRNAILKSAGDGMCIFAYILPGEENGQPVSYYHEIFFMRDELGRWRISSL